MGKANSPLGTHILGTDIADACSSRGCQLGPAASLSPVSAALVTCNKDIFIFKTYAVIRLWNYRSVKAFSIKGPLPGRKCIHDRG